MFSTKQNGHSLAGNDGHSPRTSASYFRLCACAVRLARTVMSNNLFRRFWLQLRFDVPRMTTHAASRKRVGMVFLTILFSIITFSAFYGPIALFEYKFGGGAGGLAVVAIRTLS